MRGLGIAEGLSFNLVLSKGCLRLGLPGLGLHTNLESGLLMSFDWHLFSTHIMLRRAD